MTGRPNFFKDPKKKIASIPFIRNIIEYTVGEQASDFIKLTSLLHWKSDSAAISEGELDAIYNRVFREDHLLTISKKSVLDLVHEQAKDCLHADDSLNFENKIVLSIAIRIAAEEIMVARLADPAFVAGIERNQTTRLLEKFKKQFDGDFTTIQTLERVVLMTPENIHLNSFMYEPILDMSDEHLRKLYEDVLALQPKPKPGRGEQVRASKEDRDTTASADTPPAQKRS